MSLFGKICSATVSYLNKYASNLGLFLSELIQETEGHQN